MAGKTRLGYEGYGVRSVGSFYGKTLGAAPSHPVGVITRLSLDGYGARRYSSFAGKATDSGPSIDSVIHTLPFFMTMGSMSSR